MKEEVKLLEVSWEVCNKVGGIYTVISSKAPYIANKVKDYTLIGPYILNSPPKDFIEELVPIELRDIFADMKSQGLPCHYGRWLIKSQPAVILIDFSNLFKEKNEIKRRLWERYKIDSLNTGFDFDEPIVFSFAVSKLISLIERKSQTKIIAQFHEWMTGAAILGLKENNSKINTVFTTHATVLGRAISNSNSSFYSTISKIDAEKEAKEHGVIAKHLIEKESASNADVFTTVSEITSLEAEYLLGRKADIIVPNGIDLQNFPSLEELSIRHSELKHDMKDFIMSYFFPYYSFDIDNTLIFFILGRYEFENKGIDVYIESLGILNEHLKKNKIDKTIVSFFFIPAESHTILHDVLENKTIFADLKSFIQRERPHIINKLIYLSASHTKLKNAYLLDEHGLQEIERKSNSFKKKGTPSYVTHDLRHYDQDAIINGFKRAKLFNKEEDKVKVIFYPTYLKSTDNLLNMDLYEAITSGHLGIFASSYEPWGYTPLESAALGVASITSDLSGFGKYIEKDIRKNNPGVFLLKRFKQSKENIVKDLSEILKYYASLDKEGRIENKIEARKIASLANWENLVNNYFKAYDLSLEKKK